MTNSQQFIDALPPDLRPQPDVSTGQPLCTYKCPLFCPARISKLGVATCGLSNEPTTREHLECADSKKE